MSRNRQYAYRYQLVLTAATQKLEQADIDKQTAQIRLDQAVIDAEKITTLADANAYDKRVMLEADGALQMKLDATVTMNRDTMNAMSKRQVPNLVVYSGDGGKGALGSDGDIATLAKTQVIKNLKALNLDMSVTTGKK